MLTVAILKDWGANTDEGIARCMGMEDFYLKMVGKVLTTDDILALMAKLTRKDIKGAFEEAHKLKGVYANLALTPVLKPIEKATDILRGGVDTGCLELAKEAKMQMERLIELGAGG